MQTAIALHKEIFPFFSMALYVHGIKPIRTLTIENTTDEEMLDVDVVIESDVPFLLPFHYRVSSLPAKADLNISLVDLKISRSFLAQLSESEQANLTILVKKNDEIVTIDSFAIKVYPLEYFGGFQTLPELIASYITPNHPYVYHLKRKAIEILEKQKLTTAFEGYQSRDPERVLQVMSAIYLAIQNEEIVYSALPPGYESTGQRLRLLSTIEQQKFGNCIDLSLLFIACLEAVSLHPILVIVRGHAFVGCWLQDDKFPEVVNDDKSAITKRLSKGIREIAAVEATMLCKGNLTRFSEALDRGEAQLVEQDDFILSVDVKSARAAHIRPLPLLMDVADGLPNDAGVQELQSNRLETDFEIGVIYQDELLQTSRPTNKQKVWERKLLDLSLRNNLLNIRMTRNMLQLVDIDIGQLEDILSDGQSFSIMPNPNAEVIKRYNLFTPPLHPSSPIYQFANEELKYHRLLTGYHRQDLEHILTYIHKNAKESVEENGSSTLYLAVGLLKWFDRKTPEQARYAPILLIPVEIGRRSVNSQFMLKSREEETLINITLLEFLRQEYALNLSGLDELPYDDKGVDVARVMGLLRRAVMQLKGWDIEEQLILGNFSFSKLILWKDIVSHADELVKSPMVKSLVEGKLAFYEPLSEQAEVDFDRLTAQSMTLPIATDVSQLAAIYTAQQGHSFVLHGPPGTGKSQTITNIIADALSRNKRVLFVAAKKAALDVVHHRLEQIGLSAFTLELHSNKSKKSDVLGQLAQSLEFGRVAKSPQFEQESQRLDSAKAEISDYVNALHQRQPVGWSLYDCIAHLERFGEPEFAKDIIVREVLNHLDVTLWPQWLDCLPQYQSIAQMVVHPAENPLSELGIADYSFSIADEIGRAIQDILSLLPKIQKNSDSLATLIHFPFSLQSKTSWNEFVCVAQALQSAPNCPVALSVYLEDKEHLAVYNEWRMYFERYQTVHSSILGDFNRDVLKQDVMSIEREWKGAEQSWFLSKLLKKRRIRKQLSSYRNTPFVDDQQVIQFFTQFNDYQENERILKQNRFDAVRQALGSLFKDEHTDVTDIQTKVNFIEKMRDLCASWTPNGLGQWANTILDKGIRFFDDIRAEYDQLLNDFMQQAADYQGKAKHYQTITNSDFTPQNDWIQTRYRQLEALQLHLPKLKDWLLYKQVRHQAEALHLGWLIAAFEAKKCSAGQIEDYFHYTVNRSIAHQVIAQHESLSLFNATLFERKIEQYKKIAQDYRQLTIRELQSKLSAQLPNTVLEAMQSSEIGILQRAIKNRGRGVSIRRLFDQIPTLLPRLAPCMLMSPISVAQYFNVDTKHFDLVIFDEASQLPTCEAVSALARAKQAIIVGDPKQMPPTSFFTSMKVDDEHIDVEDLESILDDCLSLSVPSRYLLRHYRSKHESLIAFSNAHYYENKLLTFPSADDLNRKVSYHHIDGFYDKGKTRTNAFEADAIVQHVMGHFADERKRKHSLGVVTFSQTQQTLIEEKLQSIFAQNPELERWATESPEPLFIKNLENVQGDERDMILFSIGYGPDEQGKISMNFGPLNRNGGWRRLNVAVTRARYEMHIFASLSSDQIDLSRTSSEGVAGLKAFLAFAEKGLLPVRQNHIQSGKYKSSLSHSIAKHLQNYGLAVRTHVGTSGFKIDLAIEHPDRPNEYILAILLDGHYYHSAQTTHDREMVMPAILQILGWNIHRVWAMDWFNDAEKVSIGILERVKNLQQQPQKIQQYLDPVAEPLCLTQKETYLLDEAAIGSETNKQKPYQSYVLPIISNANSEIIYWDEHQNTIRQQLMDIVQVESPISKDLLYRKVLYAWNIGRIGARLEKYLDSIIQTLRLKKTLHRQVFYWSEQSFGCLDEYRYNDIEKRSIDDIAPEEIMVALQETMSHNLSLQEDELLRYLAKVFNFSKVGKQIELQLNYVIGLAEKNGMVERDDGRIRCNQNPSTPERG